MPTSHQSGSLKQSNKKHKGKGSKRETKRSFGAGKVSSHQTGEINQTPSTSNKHKRKTTNNIKSNVQNARLIRLNRDTQIRKQKKTEVWLHQRLGSTTGAPKIIGIIPLSLYVDTNEILQACIKDSSWNSQDSSMSDDSSSNAVVNAFYSKHKSRSTFIQASNEIASILDVTTIADILIYAIDTKVQDVTDLIDAAGMLALSSIKAIGCPESICVVNTLEVPVTATGSMKAQAHEMRKSVYKFLQQVIGTDVKINDTCDSIALGRTLCTIAPKDIGWRSIRSYCLTNDIQVQPSSSTSNSCSVRIGGYLRGKPMNINSLAHIVGVGTGRIARVEMSSNIGPFELYSSSNSSSKTLGKSSGESASIVVDVDSSKQDPLCMESMAMSIGGEQTWPTEDEMSGTIDDGAGRHRRNIPSNIPVGMSSYQADWLVTDEGTWEEGDHSDEEMEAAANNMIPITDKIQSNATSKVTFGDDNADDDGDMDENFTIDGSVMNVNGSNAVEEKKRLRSLAQEDEDFPDEVDTPIDVAARVRFARYRALQSFRTSPWHPKENLPQEYSRIFQFENFTGAQKRVLVEGRAAEKLQHDNIVRCNSKAGTSSSGSRSRKNSMDIDSGMAITDTTTDEVEPFFVAGTDNNYISSNQYVYIVIEDLPHSAVLSRLQSNGSLMMFSLLKHENKLSMLHFNVTRCPNYAEPIKSKEKMVMHCGFRSFDAKPIYSEANLNSDKHKFERFLKSDRFSVASTYGPISFCPCPLLMFKQLADGKLMLVATGTLGSVDPDRIILKKIILTGLPIRVRKRFAVVKHLFYDTQDVRWFKPAELFTKRGLRGHIREPVGTHGLLKAQFSGPITQNDTVMLILYKRIYPKIPDDGIRSF